jgi:flagellar biosynthesis protein FlhA
MNNNKQLNTTVHIIEEKIKGASIVMYNTLYAIAIKYEQGITKTPILIYKSKNIKDSKIAAFNTLIPVFEDKIADIIANTLEIGSPITPKMYSPVAEILAEVVSNMKLKIEAGKNLQKMIKSKNFIDKIDRVRKDINSEIGLIIPSIIINANLNLSPNKYLIKLKDEIISTGEVYPNKNIIVSIKNNPQNLLLESLEPVFKLPAKWVDKNNKNYDSDGYVNISAETVIATHLKECINNNLGELLTKYDLEQLLKKFKIYNSEEYVNSILDQISIEKIQAILINLLIENIPIRELGKILEKIKEVCSKNKDNNIFILTETVRQAISKTICERNLANTGELQVITLSTNVEKTIENANKNNLTLELNFVKTLFNKINTELSKIINETNSIPVILCSPSIRLTFRRLNEMLFPQIAVMSYSEIHKDYKYEILSEIDLNEESFIRSN